MVNSVAVKMKAVWGGVVEYIARDATALARGNGYIDSNQTDAETRNAIAHTYVSANIEYENGQLIANTMGELKELAPGGDNPKDTFKDKFNNSRG